MGGRNSREENVEQETMVLAAKMGLWDRVWEILDRNPHFVNHIPENRAWGILHQACFWSNEEAIRKILSIPGCDSNLETKNGLRPIQIAKTQQLKYIIAAQNIQRFGPNLLLDKKSFSEIQHADVPKIADLLSALENKEIVQVITILETNQHLVNIVSPVTGLTPLHLAAELGFENSVRKILCYPAANAEAKTIETPKSIHEAGKTAEQLTNSEKVKEVIFWKKQKLKQECYEYTTFINIREINFIIQRYVSTTIEAHRGILCSEEFNSMLFEIYTKVTEHMYLHVHYNKKWEAVKEIVSKELYKCSRELGLECYAANSENTFFKHLITLYLSKSLQHYRKLYSETHYHEMDEKYIPEFSTYSTLLNAVLFFWPNLESYTQITYRGVNLNPDQVDTYSSGTELSWLCIKSCTKSKHLVDRADNCVFVIDNDLKCKWSPKNVAEFSQSEEEEYLYPCGAQFLVTKVDKSKPQTHIYLKLISPVDSSQLRPFFECMDDSEPSTLDPSERQLEMAAIMGNWDLAWEILDRDQQLINCIPKESSWGILHHACYWENEDAIQKILSIPECDPNRVTNNGLRPIDITKKARLQKKIAAALRKFIDIKFARIQEEDEPKIKLINERVENSDMPHVISLIEKDQHLVNVGSPDVGLAPLHLAALLKDVAAVTKILSYPASNPDVETIEAPNNKYGPGKTAEELTDIEEVKKVIKNCKKQKQKQKYYGYPPTFVDISDSNVLLMRYACSTMEAHRGLLCSEKFNYERFEVFPKLVEEMFLYIHFAGDMWQVAKVIVSRELYKFEREIALALNGQNSVENFYKDFIKIYTENVLYGPINSELRNLTNSKSKNKGSTSKYCSYSTLLNAILITWPTLISYRETTYRGVSLEADHLKQYSVGTEFAWLAFTSSSKEEIVVRRFLLDSDQTNVKCAIFEIDNRLECKWSPKYIFEFANIRNEYECLYPCGAQFRVTNIDQSESPIRINLKLICKIDSTPLRSLHEETKARAESSIQECNDLLDRFKTLLDELKLSVDAALVRQPEMIDLTTNSQFRVHLEKDDINLFEYICQNCKTQCHKLCTTQCLDGNDNRNVCNNVTLNDHCTVCPDKCHTSLHIINALPVELIRERANQYNPERHAFVEEDFNELKKMIISQTSKTEVEFLNLKIVLDEVNSKIQEFHTILSKSDSVDGCLQYRAIEEEQIILTQLFGMRNATYEETVVLCKENGLMNSKMD